MEASESPGSTLRKAAIALLQSRLEEKLEIVRRIQQGDDGQEGALVDDLRREIDACCREIDPSYKPAAVQRYSPVSSEVLRILAEHVRPMTSSEIADRMGKTSPREKNSVQCVISKLIRRGSIFRQGRMLRLAEQASDEEDEEDEGDLDLELEPPGLSSARLGSIGASHWLDGIGELVAPMPPHLVLVPPIDAPADLRSADAIRSARKREIRKQTVNLQRISKKFLIAEGALYPEPTSRPKTRAECERIPRPCPFVSCAYNLFLDVQPQNGSITLNFPDLEPDEMSESCALDVAERGENKLEDVGAHMNLTRERIRQIELKALSKLGNSAKVLREFADYGGKPTRKLHLTVVDSDPPDAAPGPLARLEIALSAGALQLAEGDP